MDTGNKSKIGYRSDNGNRPCTCQATLLDIVTSLETQRHWKRYLVGNCHFIENKQMALIVSL